MTPSILFIVNFQFFFFSLSSSFIPVSLSVLLPYVFLLILLLTLIFALRFIRALLFSQRTNFVVEDFFILKFLFYFIIIPNNIASKPQSITHLSVDLFFCADVKELFSQFSSFRREFSICSCRCSVSVEEGEFRIFLHCHLGLPLKKTTLKKNVPSSVMDCNILVHHVQKLKCLIAMYISKNSNKYKSF